MSNSKIANAAKWSTVTELAAKLVAPVVNLILARILAPEAFGILATVTMVISFAEVFVESGFQKFLIQHIFDNEKQEQQFMSVAYWTNLFISAIVWFLIIINCQRLAEFVGNPGLGFPIAVTGITLPLFGIIGIQNCKLKKELEFKKLFGVRMISSLIPLVVTLPLAVIGLDYWSLIIGNIAGVVCRSFALLIIGKFKPLLYFDFSDLKYMAKHGIWTLLDGIAVWTTNWIDSFLISVGMTDYNLGLYKNSIGTVNSLFAIVISAITPVLYVSLSKAQNDTKEFKKIFLTTQRILSSLLLPMSIGVYFYRDFATDILFGAQWQEAADIVGIMALTTALRTIFISFYGDAYRAKGYFYLPFILQLVDVAILIPTCTIALKYGFWSLVYARAFIKLDLIIFEMIFAWYVCKITPWDTMKSVAPSVYACTVMIAGILILQTFGCSNIWNVISIIICAIIYFAVLIAFKKEREFIFSVFVKKLKIKH